MKDNDKQVVYKSGISFSSMLGLCFIILKLTGFINWSWWWVLAPLWIPPVLVILLLLILLIIATILD